MVKRAQMLVFLSSEHSFIVVILELWDRLDPRLFLIAGNFPIEPFINCIAKHAGEELRR